MHFSNLLTIFDPRLKEIKRRKVVTRLIKLAPLGSK